MGKTAVTRAVWGSKVFSNITQTPYARAATVPAIGEGRSERLGGGVRERSGGRRVSISCANGVVITLGFVGLPDTRCSATEVLVCAYTQVMAGDGPKYIRARARRPSVPKGSERKPRL